MKKKWKSSIKSNIYDEIGISLNIDGTPRFVYKLYLQWREDEYLMWIDEAKVDR